MRLVYGVLDASKVRVKHVKKTLSNRTNPFKLSALGTRIGSIQSLIALPRELEFTFMEKKKRL